MLLKTFGDLLLVVVCLCILVVANNTRSHSKMKTCQPYIAAVVDLYLITNQLAIGCTDVHLYYCALVEALVAIL